MNKLNKQIIDSIKGRNLSRFEELVKNSNLNDISITLNDCINPQNPSFPDSFHAIAASILIRKGLDVNVNENEITPLLTVAKYSSYSICNLIGIELVKYGANVNARDKEGKNALFHCCNSYSHLLFIEALLNNNADVNLKIPNNGLYTSPGKELSLLHFAYWNGEHFFKKLVEKGAKMTTEEIEYLKTLGKPLTIN